MRRGVNLAIVLVLFLVPVQDYAQNVAKGFQLLKQKDHADAVEIFNKAISKKKDILASKFGLALVYSDTTYKRHRYSRAYRHIAYIERKYVKLPDNEKSGLRKEFGIDDISIGKLRLKILNEALNEAKKTGTIESLNNYRLDFPNTEQSKEAILLENKLAFDIAQSENNPDVLLEFIQKYPNATEVDSAKALLETFEEEAFEYYTSEGELEAISKFEKRYPNFKDKGRLSEAKMLAETAFKLDMDEAYNRNMEQFYLDYVKKAAPSELAYVALLRTLTSKIKEKEWASIIEQLTEYQSYFPDNKRIDTFFKILQAPEQAIILESLSENINTIGHEYAPVVTADGKTIYFCGRSREGNIGGEDIFVSKFIDSTWQKPKLLRSINSPYSHEAPLAISADGSRMLLYANTDIYYSDKIATGWSIPRPFPSINGRNSWEADAMISADGNAIFFISDRKGNVGRLHRFGELFHGSHSGNSDIYMAYRTESGWSKPINLGKTINTPYSERSPFLHPDMKTLYFSSEGHAGLGRLDVFKSERLNDSSWTEWSEPVNLGKEINSYGDEYDYKISTDGKYAFLSSLKSNNYDIYKMKLPEEVRPEYVAIVSGFITNKKGDPVQADIKWENLKTGEVIGYSKSDLDDGSYLIILPLGKNYGYFIEHKNYYPLSGNIDLTEQKEQIEIQKDFVLLSYVEIVNEKIPIPLENVFFEFNKYELKPESYSELNRLVNFIEKNEGMKVEIGGHTDNVGTEEYNKKLSQQRAQAVVNYLTGKGIEKTSIIAVGYGEAKPVTTNDTEAGKAKNRRVEFRVLEK
jgi:outer membrane protein OmpA-like peptidoglycan-associated protein